MQSNIKMDISKTLEDEITDAMAEGREDEHVLKENRNHYNKNKKYLLWLAYNLGFEYARIENEN